MTLLKALPGRVESPGFINKIMESILTTLLGASYVAFFGGLGWLGAGMAKRRNVRKPALLVAGALVVLTITTLLSFS